MLIFILRWLADLHNNVLCIGVGSSGMPYKWICDTKGYVSSVAMTETRPPNCWVSPDSRTYVVGIGALTIDTLRAGLQEVVKDIWKMHDRLVGKRFVSSSPEDIVDDLSNTTRGYSFLSEEPFSSRRYLCFFHIVETQKLGIIDAQGRFSWNKPAIEHYLANTAKLWRLVAYIQSFGGQISIRLRQYTEFLLVNCDRQRSLIWQAGELLALLPDSKMTHITEQHRYQAGFVHPLIAAIFLEFIGGGLREAEALLVHVLKGPEAAQIHRTYVLINNLPSIPLIH